MMLYNMQAFRMPITTKCERLNTKHFKTDLYSPWFHVTCHVFPFWNLRLRHWSSSVLCLLLIAIGVTWAHTGDCLITQSFSTCPSIIWLMQSFMWPFQSIPPRELQSISRSHHVTEASLQFYGIVTAFILLSGVYQPFTTICWFNGPFISCYVATALPVGGWFGNTAWQHLKKLKNLHK